MVPTDNETWLIDTGDDIIRKKAEQGRNAMTACERLVYCVWVADYSLRNAGDLLTAADLYAPFRSEAEHLAEDLSLPKIKAAFSLPVKELERAYFDAFEDICAELQACQNR